MRPRGTAVASAGVGGGERTRPLSEARDRREARYFEMVDEMLGGFAREASEVEQAPEELDRNAELVADSMLAWKWRYGGGEPGRWTIAELDAYLLEFSPRQMAFDRELIADAPRCAAAFIGFLDRAGWLSGDSASALVRRCEELRVELAVAVADRYRWGGVPSLRRAA